MSPAMAELPQSALRCMCVFVWQLKICASSEIVGMWVNVCRNFPQTAGALLLTESYPLKVCMFKH